MELWVRSQDKTRLSKITDIYVVGYGDSWAIDGYCVNGVDDFDLGIYSTKERALEVLDEIQEHLEKMGKDEILTDKIGIMNGIKHYGIVYKMPEE